MTRVQGGRCAWRRLAMQRGAGDVDPGGVIAGASGITVRDRFAHFYR